MKHALFAPSGAPRWANCTASFYTHQQDEAGSGSSIYAREGTILHDVCASFLANQVPLSTHLGYTEPYGEETITIDEDSIYACQQYIDIIQSYMLENPRHILHVEKKVIVEEDMWGTADCMLNCEAIHHLHVFDLKMGRGEEVFALENEQLMSYGIGGLNELDPFEKFPKFITLHIIQPRLPNGDIHKQWTINVAELYNLFQRIKGARETILKGFEYTKFQPGEKQCRWCNYAGDCRAFAEFTLAVAKVRFGAFTDLTTDQVNKATGESLKLSVEEKLHLKKYFPIFQTWMNKIEDELLKEALIQLQKGKRLPGHIVTESIKHRQWKDKAKMEVLLQKKWGDEAFNKKILTPAQAEKKLGKDKDKLAKYITKPKGLPILSSDHGNKKEYVLEAPKAFEKYKVE
jgi:hypothetical protein